MHRRLKVHARRVGAALAITGLGGVLGLGFGHAFAAPYAPPPPAKTDRLHETYRAMHDAATVSRSATAGRDLSRDGRAKDGKVVHALVRSDWVRLWAELHPAARRAYIRAQIRAEERRRAAMSPRELGRTMAADRGWNGWEWTALDVLWGERESGWNPAALNPSSGACGIPQALPCSKIPGGLGASAAVQIRWGLDYIAGRYGSPSGALAHSNRVGWY
jgi:hypothetical protein